MTPLSARLIAVVAATAVGGDCLRAPAGALTRDATRSAVVRMEQGSLMRAAATAAVVFTLSAATPLPSQADGDTEKFKFPPIDRTKKNRCVFLSSAIGQANAARDSLYDLRECTMDGKAAEGFDISGALLAQGSFQKTNFKEAQLSKVYGPDANFDGADFTDGVVDRAFFKGSSFKGALFVNTVLTSTSFEDANLEDTDFTGAYLGQFDSRRLCKNPNLKGTNPKTQQDTRESAGCA
mmetsp:Transcript_24719/g.67249  ORF Transcript_24719/g.67249 Transcript_24719/m.67249 type:complete len:237 (-) Transcript_24719:715-1425(-)|eukprot:CAMPEP_0185551208 /NCGR_PEP_ID=MMETSP1381-20130426/24449_1 /TAXON_ID=298111 /ORGANISM="Pavlova sp., Strain CCMP459" /LENGTH=236 /DNA_ID=CAMNT_0028164055 /DNA_START=45 /DNA_END=755 /DNA_ORIENTATION=-